MSKPYQKANSPGPEVGTTVFDPITIANIIKKSKKSLVVIGVNASNEKVSDDKFYADLLYELGKKINADIIAVSKTHKYLAEKGIKDITLMPILNLVDRLRDPEWKNLSGEGDKYDLIMFGGSLVYFVSQALSTIKNWSTYRTLTLDRYSHPNARFSVPNLEKDEWIEFLNTVIEKL